MTARYVTPDVFATADFLGVITSVWLLLMLSYDSKPAASVVFSVIVAVNYVFDSRSSSSRSIGVVVVVVVVVVG